jgi:thioredoxin 1
MDTQILFFSAPWCGPCRMMKSTLSESVRDDLNIKVIDISEDMDTATKYQVMNVPTFVKLVDGKEVARKIGSTTIETLKTL